MTKCLFDTGALHNSYIDSGIVDDLREILLPCIHQFRTTHNVILADNKSMLPVNEYLLINCSYELNKITYVVSLRLTIPPMNKKGNGNDIIIGLPEIANQFSNLFVSMIKNLITEKHRVLSPSSVPQPLHMMTEAEKDAYILEQRDRLDDRNFGRTRSSTSRLFPSDTPTTHHHHSYTVNLNVPARDLPPPPGVHIEDLTSPEPNTLGYRYHTRAIPPDPDITFTEFDLRGDPANYSRVIPSDRRSSIDPQYELVRIAKCEYHDQERPIGIDQRRYPEYNNLPTPYRPFAHYSSLSMATQFPLTGKTVTALMLSSHYFLTCSISSLALVHALRLA